MYFIHLTIGLSQLYMIGRNGLRKSLFLGIYILSFTLLDVIGSFYVYYPEISPYGLKINYGSGTFTIVLLLHQLLLFISWVHFSSKTLQGNLVSYHRQPRPSLRSIVILVSLVILLVGVDIYRNGLPIFFQNIGGELSNSELVELRSDYFERSGSFWLNTIGYYVAPMMLSIIYLISYLQRPTWFARILMIMAFVIGGSLALSFLHKTPLLVFIVTLFFVYYLSKSKINHLTRKMFFMAFGVIIVLLGQYYFVFSNQIIYSYWDILNAIINRLIGVYPLGLAVSIDLQDSTGLLLGKTFPNTLGLFPGSFNLAAAIHQELFSITGSAPAPFIGYAYINFGMIGVLTMTLISILLLRILDMVLARVSNLYLKACLYGFLFQKVVYMSMSSIFDNLLNPRDIFLCTLIFSILYLRINDKKSTYL